MVVTADDVDHGDRARWHDGFIVPVVDSRRRRVRRRRPGRRCWPRVVDGWRGWWTVLGEDGNGDRSSVGRRRWTAAIGVVAVGRDDEQRGIGRLRWSGDRVGQHLSAAAAAAAGARVR